MKYCPRWVLEIVAIHATRQYVEGHLPLSAYAGEFSRRLSDRYDNVGVRKLGSISEEIMGFLVEIDAENIFSIFDAYIFHKASFDTNGDPRKIKTLFKNAFSPVEIDVTADDVITSFKVFTYHFRAHPGMAMPVGWQLTDVDKIDWLGGLVDQPVSMTNAMEY